MITPAMRRNCRKKKAYKSKAEAEVKAEFYEKNNGAKQTPYNCEYCGDWHLTKTRNLKKKGP